MRILVAHDVPAAHVGGMNRIMRFTHDPLAKMGHEVEYFTSDHVLSENSFSRRFVFPWSVLQKAINAFKTGHKYDIINVHEVQAAWIALFKHYAGNPYVIVTAHGSEHRSWDLALEEARLGRIGPALKTRILNPLTRLWQIRIGLTYADQIFCVSEEDREYFASRLGIDRRKLVRFYSGATDCYRSADPDRLRRPVRRIVFSGTWRKNKGIEDLVPAFTLIAARHPGVELTVLGGGLPADCIKKEFPETLRSRVHPVDTTGDEGNLRNLLAADIFILPSLLEGTPLTMMEAMAAGLPVVTTSTSGMKDVIRDRENGLLVPIRQPRAMADAVDQLISDPELRVALGKHAQLDAQTKYTWETSSGNVLSAYQTLVDGDQHWLNPAPCSNLPRRPLRFSFVANFSPEWNTGAAGSILAIGKSLERSGHSVRYRWKESQNDRFSNSTLNNLMTLPKTQLEQVREELEDFPDVVIVSQPFAYSVFEQLAEHYPETIFLNLTHGWEHRYDIAERTFGWQDDLHGLHGLKRRLAMAARARICRRTAVAMDGLLAPSAMDGHFVIRRYGVSQDKLLLMTYGLEECFLADTPHSSGSPSRRMLFFGQYVPRKGSLLLERIIPRLGREFSDAEVTFVVPSTQIAEVERKYRSSFGPRLKILEWMDRRELINICQLNDIFLFPSMLEGFGKTFLEAMACGLCVVGYSEGGLPHIARNGREAFYCAPGDEAGYEQLLRTCLMDPATTHEVGRRAKARAQEFTWQKTAATLVAFCLERLHNKRNQLPSEIPARAGSTIEPLFVNSLGCTVSTHDIAD